MEAKALYTERIEDEGTATERMVRSVALDNGGGFVVSSEKVGVAVQNFLNNATAMDMRLLHSHLLVAHHHAMSQLEELPMEDDPCDCGTVRGESGLYLAHAPGDHLDCTANES